MTSDEVFWLVFRIYHLYESGFGRKRVQTLYGIFRSRQNAIEFCGTAYGTKDRVIVEGEEGEEIAKPAGENYWLIEPWKTED